MKNTYDRSVNFQYWVVTRKGFEALCGLMRERIEKLGFGSVESVSVGLVSGNGREYDDIVELMGNIDHLASRQDSIRQLRVSVRVPVRMRCEMRLFFFVDVQSSCFVSLSGNDTDGSCAEWVEETTMLLEAFRDAVVPEGEIGEDIKESSDEFVMFDLEEHVAV